MSNKVTGKSDYRFVTGDLDKIVIDGGIMPSRAEKRIMRGEDIAWLMEAACERIRAYYTLATTTSKFSREISASQINALRNLSYVILAMSTKCFVDPGKLSQTVFSNRPTGSPADFLCAVVQLEDPGTVKPGDVVKADPIEKMFANVAKMTHTNGSNAAPDAFTPTTFYEGDVVPDDPASLGQGQFYAWHYGAVRVYDSESKKWTDLTTQSYDAKGSGTLVSMTVGNGNWSGKHVDVWCLLRVFGTIEYREVGGSSVSEYKQKFLFCKVDQQDMPNDDEVTLSVDASKFLAFAGELLTIADLEKRQKAPNQEFLTQDVYCQVEVVYPVVSGFRTSAD